MKKKVKGYASDMIGLGVTGVGLGLMSGLDETGSVGGLGKVVGVAGTVRTIGFAADVLEQKKKGKRLF